MIFSCCFHSNQSTTIRLQRMCFNGCFIWFLQPTLNKTWINNNCSCSTRIDQNFCSNVFVISLWNSCHNVSIHNYHHKSENEKKRPSEDSDHLPTRKLFETIRFKKWEKLQFPTRGDPKVYIPTFIFEWLKWVVWRSSWDTCLNKSIKQSIKWTIKWREQSNKTLTSLCFWWIVWFLAVSGSRNQERHTRQVHQPLNDQQNTLHKVIETVLFWGLCEQTLEQSNKSPKIRYIQSKWEIERENAKRRNLTCEHKCWQHIEGLECVKLL